MFKLEFNTDNIAFDEAYDECSRILQHISILLANGEDSGPVIDINGNTIGTWSLT